MELIKIERAGQIVLTTKQLAKVYKTKPENLSENFSKAKDQFKEGIHYFKLTGEPLRQFKRQYPALADKFAPHLYLWTEKGVFLHAKKMNTAKAFVLFDGLGDKLRSPTMQDLVSSAKGIPRDKACAYVFEMSNCTVKIGASKNIERRIPQIEYKSGFKVVRTYQTCILPRELAFRIESACHEHFKAKRIRGEYFSVPFEEACAEVQKQLPAPKVLDFAVVYCLLMSNGTVKIGMTTNLAERTKGLKAQYKLEVLDYYSTGYMSREEASGIEEALKARYADCSLGNEFYDVRFAAVKEVIAMARAIA